MALDQSRRDLSKAHAQINQYKHEYDSVMPTSQYDILERQLTQVSNENDRLASDNSTLKREYDKMVATIRDLNKELKGKKDFEEEERIGGLMKDGLKKWQKEMKIIGK